MELQEIGNSGIQTPPIMFGGNVFGWTLNEKESFRMLDMLLERNWTFIDTADIYGKEYGLSEHIIGKWIKKRNVRDKITIATKGGRVHRTNSDGKKSKDIDNRKMYLQKCIADSLERLQTDYIDLYYTHFDDKVTPTDIVLNTYKDYLESGKIKEIGGSNYSAHRLKEILYASEEANLPKYQIFQTEYSLVERKEFEKEFRDLIKQYQVQVATYFSLASGFLTGKYQRKSDFKGTARQNLTEKYFNDQGKRVLKALDEVAEEHNASNAGVALAWILNRPQITTAIASATKESHLNSFEEAIHLRLSKEDMNKLNNASNYQ